MPEIPLSEKRQGLHPGIFSGARVETIANSLAVRREMSAKCESQARRLLKFRLDREPGDDPFPSRTLAADGIRLFRSIAESPVESQMTVFK
jgi:hypothetical protein